MKQNLPLVDAAIYSDLELCKALVASGIDINEGAENGSPLHIAAENGELDICRLLVGAGAQHSRLNEDGLTPLMLASRRGNSEVCSLLMEAGASPEEATDTGGTALTMAGCFDESAELNVLKALLGPGIERGAQPSERLVRTASAALLGFATRGRAGACEQLIRAGADVNYTDHRDWTPLHVAAANDRLDVCTLLLEHGADPTLARKCSRHQPMTPFHLAVDMAATSVVAHFLNHLGEDPDQCAADGRTMLKLAAQRKPITALLESARMAKEICSAIDDAKPPVGIRARSFRVAL